MALVHTPKTDYTPEDGINSDDFNKPNVNIQSLEDTKIEIIPSPVTGDLVMQKADGQLEKVGISATSPTFSTIEGSKFTSNSVVFSGSSSMGSWSIGGPGTVTPSAGVYMFLFPTTLTGLILDINAGGPQRVIYKSERDTGGMFFTDGSSVQIVSGSGTPFTIHYRKMI